MASDRVLDVDSLLAPVPGDLPAGQPTAYGYGLRDKLNELRVEESPEDFDDATRPAQLKRADWPGVVRIAVEALTTQSKDLRVVCHLLEGASKAHGFAGLRDGLLLLRRLIEECWERLNPPIDDGDLDVRAAPLANMLDDPERGIRFPNTVRNVPIFGMPPSIGYAEWNRIRSGPDSAAKNDLATRIAATPREQLQSYTDNLQECLDEIKRLIPLLDQRMGSLAPGLTMLGSAIADCHRAASQELAAMLPVEAPAAVPTAEAEAVPAGSNQATSRAEAYQQLRRAADVLEQLEPHSPIPYLVKRAVELGRLPFPRLMKQLIRDGNVLSEMNRELGIIETTENANAV